MFLLILTFNEVAETFLMLQIFGHRDALCQFAHLHGLTWESLVDWHKAGLYSELGKLDGQRRVKPPPDRTRTMHLDVFWPLNGQRLLNLPGYIFWVRNRCSCHIWGTMRHH